MYNTCLARAPLHFTTPSHFQSFSFPFPASGWKGEVPSTWDEWETEFVQREVTGTVSRSRIPQFRWATLSWSFPPCPMSPGELLWEKWRDYNEVPEVKEPWVLRKPSDPLFPKGWNNSDAIVRWYRKADCTEFLHTTPSRVLLQNKTRLQRRCLNEWQPEH